MDDFRLIQKAMATARTQVLEAIYADRDDPEPFAFRTVAVLDAINERNIPWFLKGSSLQRFITRVIVAPQKATGKHKENQLVFKECPVNSDGEFTLDGLKNGWKK